MIIILRLIQQGLELWRVTSARLSREVVHEGEFTAARRGNRRSPGVAPHPRRWASPGPLAITWESVSSRSSEVASNITVSACVAGDWIPMVVRCDQLPPKERQTSGCSSKTVASSESVNSAGFCFCVSPRPGASGSRKACSKSVFAAPNG